MSHRVGGSCIIVVVATCGTCLGDNISSFDLSSSDTGGYVAYVNPGETVTLDVTYGSGPSATIRTPYTILENETPDGFTWNGTTKIASYSPANANSIEISTAGWAPGIYHFSLDDGSSSAYRDFAIKVGMPYSYYRVVEEYDGPLAGGTGGLVQNLLALPDGSVLAGRYRTTDGGETWATHLDSGDQPLLFGVRLDDDSPTGSGTIIGMDGDNDRIGPIENDLYRDQRRTSTNDGETSGGSYAYLNVPARDGNAHAEYYGPKTYRSIIELDNGDLLMTAYARFDEDTNLWRWDDPDPYDTPSQRTRSIVLRSTNDGLNWDYYGTIASDDQTEDLTDDEVPLIGMEGYNETVLRQLPGGDLLALVRTGDNAHTGYEDNPLIQARSTDGGATWSAPRRTGVEGVSPDLEVMSDGNLVATVGRPGHSLMFSFDNGNTWVDHTPLEPERYRGYMAVAEMEPGKLLVSYRAKDWLNPSTGTRQDVTRVKRLSVTPWGEGTIAYESFDYDASNLGDEGVDGGYGFDGPWYSDVTLTTDADVTLADESVDAPSGYGMAPEGGRVRGVNSDTRAAYRKLDTDHEVDLGVEQDYFFSVLLERSGSGPGSESFTFSLYDGTTAEAQYSISSNGIPTILGLGSTVSGGSSLVDFDDPVLLAMKISADDTGYDQAFFKIYDSTDVVNLREPDVWDVVGSTSENSSGVIDRIGFAWGSETSLVYNIDEIRMATTWEEAVILGGRRNRSVGQLAHEPFDYSTDLGGANGGTGFDGPWYANAALTVTADATVESSDSLLPTSGYGLTADGGRVRGVSGDTHSAFRKLATDSKIDLDSDDAYYLSALVRRSGEGAGSESFIVSLMSDASTNEAQFAVSSNGKLNILDLGDSAVTDDPVIGFDETFLLVIKILTDDTSGSHDQAFFHAFGADDFVTLEEPLDWTLVGNTNENSDGLIDRIGFSWGSETSMSFEIDELRLAKTWAGAVLFDDAIMMGSSISQPLSGDLDGDGFVGVSDLNIVLVNWNQSVASGDWSDGDASGDGYVGVDDLNVVLSHWNTGTPPSVAIPEPASLSLAGGLLGGLALRRRWFAL